MRSVSFRPRSCRKFRFAVLAGLAAVSAHLAQAWPQARTATGGNTQSRGAANAAPADATLLASQPMVTSDAYRVHGVVLDSHTGKPIARALVEGFGDRLATLSDHDGRFALELRFTEPANTSGIIHQAVLSGQMVLPLTVRKPGYVTRGPQQQVQVLLTAPDQDVILKLTPQSVIQGRVAAAGDDHPENVRIALLSRRAQEGYSRWVQTSFATSNSRGEYRFGDLQAGEYKLMTQVWNDKPGEIAQFNEPESRYAPVYYPAGSAGGSGTDLHVDAGETVPVNLNIRPETFYPVHIPVALPSAGNAGVQARVQRVGSSGPVAAFNLRYNAREKVVEGLLPDGVYEVSLQESGREASAATLSVAVKGSAVQTAPVTLLPLLSIPVVVHQDFTQGQSAGSRSGVVMGMGANQGMPVHATLMQEEMNGPTPMLNRAEGDPDRLEIQHVLPGKYRVEIWGQQGYVASATSGGTDLLHQSLVVSASGGVAPIEITLRDDSATVHGAVDPAIFGSLPPTLLFVVCVPPQPFTQRLVQTVVPAAGKFTLSNIPPGSYRIFASRRPFDEIEYNSETFLQRNGSKGYPVTLEPGSSTTVTLTAVLDEEP